MRMSSAPRRSATTAATASASMVWATIISSMSAQSRRRSKKALNTARSVQERNGTSTPWNGSRERRVLTCSWNSSVVRKMSTGVAPQDKRLCPSRRSSAAFFSVATTSGGNAFSTRRDGQSRLSWGATPVDIFLTTDEFHEHVSTRLSLEPFQGVVVPFLSCTDLAVFKAFFDRRRDWADIEEMMVAHTIDADAVAAVVADLLGADDIRISKLREIQSELS